MKGVYCIKNIRNGRLYIGSSRNVEKRINQHFATLRAKTHGNKNIQDDYNSGSSWFVSGVIEEVDDENNLIEREQFHLDRISNLYNICLIADSSFGVKRRTETIEKVRSANQGLVHPEWRNKIKSKSQGGDNHWTKKRKVPFSEESRKKMSETHKALYRNGYKHPNAIKVAQYTTDGVFVKEWDSSEAVARHFNCNSQTIRNYINNGTKNPRKTKGFIWKEVKT